VGTVLIDYTRPPEYLGHISTDILTIFFFYFAVRSPLKMQFTIAISFTVAILTILFVHKQPPDSLYYFNIPVILALANLIGYLGARQHSVVRHTQFLENKQLLEAHDNVRTLSGLVPICSGCKKIRTDDGYWQQIEAFINERSELNFSHGICPDCKVDLYPELLDDK